MMKTKGRREIRRIVEADIEADLLDRSVCLGEKSGRMVQAGFAEPLVNAGLEHLPEGLGERVPVGADLPGKLIEVVVGGKIELQKRAGRSDQAFVASQVLV
nr:hypothetical protein [Peteryoungia ipomoeae]